MTPKEKAAELVEKYYSNKCFNGNYGEDYNVKECALIALEFAKNNYAIEDDYQEIESIKQEIIKL